MTGKAYENETLYKLNIIVPETVYEWLCARAEAESEADGREYLPEDAASAEVVASMEYFLMLAEADAEAGITTVRVAIQ